MPQTVDDRAARAVGFDFVDQPRIDGIAMQRATGMGQHVGQRVLTRIRSSL
jgi:hypothetical protein